MYTNLKSFAYHDHVALQNIRLLNESVKEIPWYCYPKFDKTLIKKRRFELTGKRLLIELSNNRITSQMCIEKLVDILNSLYCKEYFSLLISVKAGDEQKGRILKEKLNIPSEVVITPTLDDFIALVNETDYFLLGDGGAAHIAGALDKAGVALYGGTSVGRWDVLSKRVIHLYDEKDINNIDVDDVVKSLLLVMKKY